MPRWTGTPIWDIGELDCVVLAAPDGFAEVLADLLDVDIEGSGELNIANVIATEIDVHQAGYEHIVRSVSVILDALDER